MDTLATTPPTTPDTTARSKEKEAAKPLDEPVGSASYVAERFDSLPFSSPAKAERYRTERYAGAIGLNWFTCDPSLQWFLRAHLGSQQKSD